MATLILKLRNKKEKIPESCSKSCSRFGMFSFWLHFPHFISLVCNIAQTSSRTPVSCGLLLDSPMMVIDPTPRPPRPRVSAARAPAHSPAGEGVSQAPSRGRPPLPGLRPARRPRRLSGSAHLNPTDGSSDGLPEHPVSFHSYTLPRAGHWCARHPPRVSHRLRLWAMCRFRGFVSECGAPQKSRGTWRSTPRNQRAERGKATSSCLCCTPFF